MLCPQADCRQLIAPGDTYLGLPSLSSMRFDRTCEQRLPLTPEVVMAAIFSLYSLWIPAIFLQTGTKAAQAQQIKTHLNG